MEPIPIPSHIHYELLLRLLERQTLPAIDQNSPLMRDQTQQLIITLRKALAQQKQIESSLEQRGTPIDYRWSLNSVTPAESSLGGRLEPAVRPEPSTPSL